MSSSGFGPAFRLLSTRLAPTTTTRLRTAVQAGVDARAAHFFNLPRVCDVFKNALRSQDPLYRKLQERFDKAQRRKNIALAKRRKRREARERIEKEGSATTPSSPQQAAKAAPLSLGSEDLWAVAERVSKQLAHAEEHPTAETDPQMLRAINMCQANIWMTHAPVREALLAAMAETSVARAVRDNTDIRNPVLFADLPCVRGDYCRPEALTFAAPLFGLTPRDITPRSCCAFVMTLDDAGPLRCPMYVLPESRSVVASTWGGLPLHAYDLDCPAIDSHIPLWLSKFPSLMAPGAPAAQRLIVPSGTVAMVDPFVFWGFGANTTASRFTAIRFLVVDRDAIPNLRCPSWIRYWRTRASQVDFRDSNVFLPIQ